jgi:hypothetical protein
MTPDIYLMNESEKLPIPPPGGNSLQLQVPCHDGSRLIAAMTHGISRSKTGRTREFGSFSPGNARN